MMISLSGKKIRLRAVEPSDSDLILEWENNETNWQLSNTLTPFSKHTIDRYVETAHHDIFENKQLRLMIEELENKKTIGSIDLFDFDPYHLRAGVGILINNKQDRNRGFAKESVNLLINYCKDKLYLNQLYCNISQSNIASIYLFESCGFTQTGVKKAWQRLSHDKWDDVLFYQLLF